MMLQRTRVRHAPLKLLVLTMVPGGGAMTEAVRMLGYHPYTLDHTFGEGRAIHHLNLWNRIVRKESGFYDALLDPNFPRRSRRAPTASRWSTADLAECAALDNHQTRCFDALVGPPATLAWESILHSSPSTVRVVLVEEVDKTTWEQEMIQLLTPLLTQTRRLSWLSPIACMHEFATHVRDVRMPMSPTPRPLASSSLSSSSAYDPAAHTIGLAARLQACEDYVKAVVPRERLLVYHYGQGWSPLAEFTQRPIPRELADEATRRTTKTPVRDGAELCGSTAKRAVGCGVQHTCNHGIGKSCEATESKDSTRGSSRSSCRSNRGVERGSQTAYVDADVDGVGEAMPFPSDDRGAAVMGRIFDSLHRVLCLCVAYTIFAIVVLCVAVRYVHNVSAPLRARYCVLFDAARNEIEAGLRRRGATGACGAQGGDDTTTSVREIMKRSKQAMVHLMRGPRPGQAVDGST